MMVIRGKGNPLISYSQAPEQNLKRPFENTLLAKLDTRYIFWIDIKIGKYKIVSFLGTLLKNVVGQLT